VFHFKGVLAGAILALGLISAPIVQAQTNTPDTSKVTEIPPIVPGGVLGYYTTDGGKTFIPIKEEKGVAERIPSDMSKEKFMESYKMTLEAEAKSRAGSYMRSRIIHCISYACTKSSCSRNSTC